MLFESVFALYQKECRAKGSGLSEEEYDAAKAILPSILPDEQLDCLREAEKLCFENAQWLAEFAFIRGVYTGFQQHFIHYAPPEQFKALVFDEVLQMPGMQLYPEYYARRGTTNELFAQSRKWLLPAASDQVVEIEVTWQNRFLGVCRHGFHLGCRFALSLVWDAVSGEASGPDEDRIRSTVRELRFSPMLTEQKGKTKREGQNETKAPGEGAAQTENAKPEQRERPL